MKAYLLPFRQWFPFMLLLVVASVSIKAQRCSLRIKGQIFHAETNAPLSFANVAIKESNKGTIADEDGQYVIDNLCAGTYTIVCTHIGCDHVEHQFTLNADDSLNLNFFLEESSVLLEDVIVKAEAIPLMETQAVSSLSKKELASTKGQNLGQALERVPGIANLQTGTSISKPVIQGLHSNRILILVNGVRQEGQQWGLEHAPPIDPFLADEIKVIKGANSVRYGAGAMGGVILLEPRKLPQQVGLGGELNLAGFSNGRTGVVSGMLEGKLSEKLPISGRLQGTLKKGGNIQTPTYYLNNTGIEEYNFSWALGMQKEKWSTEVFYSNFNTKVGIFSGAHIGNLTDLMNAIERENPLEKGNFSYKIGRPQQRILHELLKVKASVLTGDLGKLKLQLSRQFNRRQEFDAHRQFGSLPDNFDEPEIEFEITTYAADLDWTHRPIRNVRGSIGGQVLLQKNTTDFGALIPNYDNTIIGAYWIERWKKSPTPVEVEAGLRYDYQQLAIGMQGRDSINTDLAYSNFSATLGAIYRFSKAWQLRLNLGTAWRAPNANELFSDGVHHGSASYELGRSDLAPERAFDSGLTLEFDNGNNLSASINGYYNIKNDFIFLEPQATPQLTIRGAFPAFHYQQANVRMTGLDWQMAYRFLPKWSLQTQGAIIRAWNRDIEDHLLLMPADRFEQSLEYRFDKEEEEDTPYVKISMINVLEQKRVPADSDYAPPPPGHTRFNVEAGFTVRWNDQPLRFGLSVYNLFNTRYREYLNRFRYFADELGRNVSLRLTVPFE